MQDPEAASALKDGKAIGSILDFVYAKFTCLAFHALLDLHSLY